MPAGPVGVGPAHMHAWKSTVGLLARSGAMGLRNMVREGGVGKLSKRGLREPVVRKENAIDRLP
jgi:hypothetical protein